MNRKIIPLDQEYTKNSFPKTLLAVSLLINQKGSWPLPALAADFEAGELPGDAFGYAVALVEEKRSITSQSISRFS